MSFNLDLFEKVLSPRDKEQLRCMDAIRSGLAKDKRALVWAATGFGKSYVIKLIAEEVKAKNTRMLAIIPRIALATDLSQRIEGSTVFCASLGKKEISKITIATKQSFALEHLSEFDLILLDETHNYSEEYLLNFKDKFVVGFSATPWRDNGPMWGIEKFFRKLDYSFTIQDAIKNKFVCDYKIFGVSLGAEFNLKKYKNKGREYTKKELEEIVASSEVKIALQIHELVQIVDKTERKKVAILCVNIEHAEMVASELSKHEPTMLVHSKLSNAQELIEQFKKDRTRYCVSVMMITEGYDAKSTDCVVFMRPTKSTRLMVQASGRGLRTDEDNPDKWCLLIDYGDTFLSCGTPKEPLIPIEKKDGERTKAPLAIHRRCEKCYLIYLRKFERCPDCDHKNLHKDPVENLNVSASAKTPTFKMVINKANLHFKDGVYGIKYSEKKQPYIGFKTTKGYCTVFGDKAWQVFNHFKEHDIFEGVFQFKTDRKGKPQLRLKSFC
jgi:superfamily II DNA or RNA helicase